MTDISNEEHLWLLTAYGAKDAITQGRVLEPILGSIQHHGTRTGFESDSRLAPIIRDMGLLGFCQDRTQAQRFETKIKTRMDSLLKQMRELTGKENLNPRSPPQVAKWLYTEYENGALVPPMLQDREDDDWEDLEDENAYSVGREALLSLEETGVPEEISKFINLKIQYGSLSTLLTTNIQRVYDSPPHPANPSLYTWLQPDFRIETSTARLKSRPNVQNYAKRGFVNTRTLFVAPGWIEDPSHEWGFRPDPDFPYEPHVFVSTDSAQIELRFYAGESNDQFYCKAFREGLDAHSLNVASLDKPGASMDIIMKVYDDFMAKRSGKQGSDMKAMAENVRTLYKCVVFSMLYGSGWQKVFALLSKQTDKATGVRAFPDLYKNPGHVEKIYKTFKRVHPELGDWHTRVDNLVQTRGYVEEGYGGRRIIYPWGQAEPNAARNFTIQAAAASHMAENLMTIAEAAPYQGFSPWSGPVTQVHDEITVCVPVSKAYEIAKISQEAFTGSYKGVPLEGDPEVSIRYAGKQIPLDKLPRAA